MIQSDSNDKTKEEKYIPLNSGYTSTIVVQTLYNINYLIIKVRKSWKQRYVIYPKNCKIMV